jgi:hypothetical protein
MLYQQARHFRLGDTLAWICYCAVVSTTVVHHEPWADEAEAWLMSRDLPLGRLLLSEMRYEGSPGLWHLLLWCMTRLHLPYASLNWMAALFAMGGAAFIIFKAPFPQWIRYGLAGSYWIVYQYAVIARPYVMAPLLVFAVAELSPRARQKTLLFTVVLVLLAFDSAYGCVIAIIFALGYAFTVVPNWKLLDTRVRRNFLYSSAAFTCFLLLIAAEVFPPKDVMVPSSGHNLDRVYDCFNGALLDWFPASLTVALVFLVWSWRRRNLLIYSVGLGGVIGLYGFVHGWPHHYGMAFLMIFGALWQSWPESMEVATFSSSDKNLYRCTLFSIGALLALQLSYAMTAIYHDDRLPYCGAKEVATYLRAMVNRGQKIYGFDYGMNSVLAYFDHNIFANLSELNGGTSYFHHSAPYVVADRESFLTFRQHRPEYLLFICWRPPQGSEIRSLATSNGYTLEHVFPGRLIDKWSFGVYQTYFLYRRNDLPGQAAPEPREMNNELTCY